MSWAEQEYGVLNLWMMPAPEEVERPGAKRRRGHPCHSVVAVLDDGSYIKFPSVMAATEWIGMKETSVSVCCRLNLRKNVVKKRGRSKGYHINTEHRIKGVRWYYEEDDVWKTKIREDAEMRI